LPQPSQENRQESPTKTYRGFSGVILSKNQLEKAIEHGCAWCEQEYIDITKPFAWLDTDKPVCHKCLKGEEEPDNAGQVPTTATVH
jgi:hypothetical protein